MRFALMLFQQSAKNGGGINVGAFVSDFGVRCCLSCKLSWLFEFDCSLTFANIFGKDSFQNQSIFV